MISIVIPSLNRVSLYERTLPSVTDLMLKFDIEVLVVFDGDITNDVRRLQLRDQSIKTLSTDGLGGLQARLFGARQAKYKKVLFLDDDDELICDGLTNEMTSIFSSEFSILSVNAVWPKHPFIQWYISIFKMRAQTLDSNYVPATFSGMILDKIFLMEIPKEIATARTFQDVLIYNYAISRGIIPNLNVLAVNFYQSFSPVRNSQDVHNRFRQAKMLFKNNKINKKQFEKIAESIFFTNLRQCCSQGNLKNLSSLNRTLFQFLNISTIIKITIRLIFELPIFMALLARR